MLKKMTQVFQVVAIAALAYCAARWYAFAEPGALPALEENRFEPKAVARNDPVLDSQSSFAEYSRIFSQREIFVMPYAKEPPGSKARAVEPPAAPKADLVNFRLRGIVLDQHPQALVEDLAQKETLFLSPGEPMGEGILREVREDRVIVVVHDSSLELLLED
ncbi:MAG TPA: hypothetical protein PLT76_06565 [Candidatus Omnitrophota bacterium]|nr:hypothetical protein [Candidatus Omnitrophota bacterium]HPB67634.1 hypothetical protein [Candidatus Omnitrophota bacterium]HQO58369.1 hypothetical protein [Candidatus Omnitrophota bacterium]